VAWRWGGGVKWLGGGDGGGVGDGWARVNISEAGVAIAVEAKSSYGGQSPPPIRKGYAPARPPR
jgi:hypothetical protein